MEQYLLYKITNDFNDKIYIGQTTTSLKVRFQRHKAEAKDKTYFHLAMKKHGPKHFQIHLIRELPDQESLDEAEYEEIQKYPKDKLYNTKYSKGHCGGDTLTNHPNKKEICKKVAASKIGGKNPHARAVVAHNVRTDETLEFESIKECSDYLGCCTHHAVSKRCARIIKILYRGEWEFHYKMCIDQA